MKGIDVLPRLWSSGIEIIDPFLDCGTAQELARLVDPLLRGVDRRTPGVRRVLQREPRIAEVLQHTRLADLLGAIGGEDCGVVRALLFDKSGDANWMVPWHQDATIAVAERIDVPGFTLWAVKDDEHHCRPPPEVLNALFTIRIHLDPCTAANGPLRVIAGSHRAGVLDDAPIERCASTGQVVVATVGLGGVVLTIPLAVHSSTRSTEPASRRRVLHLDCTSISLPGGLRWAESWHPRATASAKARPSSKTHTAP